MTTLFDEAVLEARRVGNGDETLAAVMARPKTGPDHGLVAICPGLGKTMRHSAIISRVLNRHGFATLRFDLSHHSGRSDGDIFDATLTQASSDIAAIVRHAVESDGRQPVVLASSLAARAAIRAASAPLPLTGLVLVLPAVNFRSTVEAVVGDDLVRRWETGEVRDPTTPVAVWSHTLSFAFIQDAVEHDLATLDSTRPELEAIPCPVAAIAAAEDTLVDIADVTALFCDDRQDRQMYVVESTSHDLAASFPAVRVVFETVTRILDGLFAVPDRAIRHLEFSEVVETVKSEKRWLRSTDAVLAEGH